MEAKKGPNNFPVTAKKIPNVYFQIVIFQKLNLVTNSDGKHEHPFLADLISIVVQLRSGQIKAVLNEII